MENNEKQEVLVAAANFMAVILSLWNKEVDNFNYNADQKISKEEFYEELKKDNYEI